MKETLDLTLPSPAANIEIELHPKDTEVLQINFGMDEANSFQNSELDLSIPEVGVESKLKMLAINEENGPAPYDLDNAFVPLADGEASMAVNFDQETLSNEVLKPEDIVVNESAEEAALYAEYLQYTQQFYNQQLIGELNDETNKSYPLIFPEETAPSLEEQQNENIVLNSDSFLSGLNTISNNNSNMDITTNNFNHTNKGLYRNVANNSNHSSDAFTSVLSSLTSPPTFPLGSSSPELFLLSPDQQWQDPEWANGLNNRSSISGSADVGDSLRNLKNWSLAEDNRPGSTSSHIMGLNSMSSISADDFDHSHVLLNHNNNSNSNNNNNSFNNINSKISNSHNSSFNHSINNINNNSNSMYNNMMTNAANNNINRSSLISSIPIITRLRNDSNDSASDSDTEKDKNILNNRDGNILNAHSNSAHSRSTQNSHKNNEINIYSDSYDDSIEWTYQPNTTLGVRNSATTSPALVLTPRVPSVPTVLSATKSPGVAQIPGQLNTLAINSSSPGASVQQVVVNMGTSNKAAQPYFIPLPPTAVQTKQKTNNANNNSNISNNSNSSINSSGNNAKQTFSQQSQYQQQQLQQSLAQKELGNQFIPLHNNISSTKQQISSPNQMVSNFTQQQPAQNYGVRSTVPSLPHQQMQQNLPQNAPFNNNNSNSNSNDKAQNNMYTAGIQAQYPVPSGTYQNGQYMNPSHNSNSNSQFAPFIAQQSQQQYNTPPLHPAHSQQQQQQYQHQQYQQQNTFQSSMQPQTPPSFQQPLPQPQLTNHFPPQYHTQSLPTRPLQQQQQPQLSQYNGQKPFLKPPSHISSYGNGGNSGGSNNKNAEQYIEYVYKVEFKKKCNEYLLSVSCVDRIQIGDVVIVSADSLEVDPHRRGTVTHRGEDLGVLVEIIPLEQYIYTTKRDMKNKPFLSIMRLAYESEKMRIVQKINDEAEVFLYARELAYTVYNLNIQILDAEYQFDRKKLTIYYDCVGKAGFENFVKAMYSTFKTRIWMELWPQK